MAITRHIETIKHKLDTIPISHGQIIYCSDSKDTFVDDSSGDRVKLGDVIVLVTEEEREEIFVPIPDKIYLVKTTNKFYRYDKEWVCINNSTVSVKGAYWIEEPTDSIPINIQGFNKNEDTLFVFINSTYLEQDEDYIIDELSMNIKYIDDGIWDASPTEPQVFNFIVFKNIQTVTSIANINRENTELYNIKKENAMMLYIMLINKLDVSLILTNDRLEYIKLNKLWTIEMIEESKKYL